jgi:hypothetical protein
MTKKMDRISIQKIIDDLMKNVDRGQSSQVKQTGPTGHKTTYG